MSRSVLFSLSFVFQFLVSYNFAWAEARIPRTVMVQLFEWSWEDITRECELYLGPKGFSAVQVSPPQEHLVNDGNTWWSRYQVVSYKLESRSGSESQFRRMVQRCQAVGVDVYVDTVLNHMTGVVSGIGSAGTRFTQYDYPNLYDYNDFHFCGRNGNNDIRNWNDLYELHFCQLVGLADLKTESPRVQNIQGQYLNHLLDLGVSGFRVDAAKHIPPEDLQNIFSKIKKRQKDPYIYLELIVGPGEPIPVQQYLNFADINLFSYPFLIGNAFHQGKLAALSWINREMPPSDQVIVFLENHDLQRMDRFRDQLLLSHLDPELSWLGTVFMLTWPYGYPQLYSSYQFSHYDDGPPRVSALDSIGNCQLPWRCEHRIPGIAELVQFRNYTDSRFGVSQFWSNQKDQIAFSRGDLGFVVINGSTHELKDSVPTSLPDGEYCNILQYSALGCSSGVRVINQQAQVFVPAKSALVLQRNLRTFRPTSGASQ